MNPKEKAKDLIAFYFKTTFEAAGLEWTNDNNADMSCLVDLLLEAVKYEMPEALV
jgi:hypothetical protein